MAKQHVSQPSTVGLFLLLAITGTSISCGGCSSTITIKVMNLRDVCRVVERAVASTGYTDVETVYYTTSNDAKVKGWKRTMSQDGHSLNREVIVDVESRGNRAHWMVSMNRYVDGTLVKPAIAVTRPTVNEVHLTGVQEVLEDQVEIYFLVERIRDGIESFKFEKRMELQKWGVQTTD